MDIISCLQGVGGKYCEGNGYKKGKERKWVDLRGKEYKGRYKLREER